MNGALFVKKSIFCSFQKLNVIYLISWVKNRFYVTKTITTCMKLNEFQNLEKYNDLLTVKLHMKFVKPHQIL